LNDFADLSLLWLQGKGPSFLEVVEKAHLRGWEEGVVGVEEGM
jgi:hypothetical protein